MRIGFIGTGAMAQAIARGAVASGVDPATLIFSNRTPDKACDLADELGATAASSNVSLARQADIVILAVKPKDQSCPWPPGVPSTRLRRISARAFPSFA